MGLFFKRCYKHRTKSEQKGNSETESEFPSFQTDLGTPRG